MGVMVVGVEAGHVDRPPMQAWSEIVTWLVPGSVFSFCHLLTENRKVPTDLHPPHHPEPLDTEWRLLCCPLLHAGTILTLDH